MELKVTQVTDNMHLIVHCIIDLDNDYCLVALKLSIEIIMSTSFTAYFIPSTIDCNNNLCKDTKISRRRYWKEILTFLLLIIVVYLTSLWNRNDIDILCQEMVTLWCACIKPYNEDESQTWEMKSTTRNYVY